MNLRLHRIWNRILRYLRSKRRGTLIVLGLIVFALFFSIWRQIFSIQKFPHFTYIKGKFYLRSSKFRYVAGGIHYFRVPRALWRDRLERVHALGANVIDTYIPWNFHERDNATYDFTGDRDVFKFLRLVQQLGMHAIVRPGPYICAEWDWGGLPARLLNAHNLRVRSSDQRFMQPAADWLRTILSRLVPLLHENGGPIILTQIENEYGFYGCEREYMEKLYAIFRQELGPRAILFTSDFIDRRMISCGRVPNGTITALDFPLGLEQKAIELFREFNPPDVPLVFGEFYPGWFDRWGHGRELKSTDAILKSLEGALSAGANVGLYMAHGGTNWAFWNGANLMPQFEAATTSYDYQAPISETGDLTSRFHAMRALIGLYVPNRASGRQMPSNSSKRAYGSVPMRAVADLSHVLSEHFDAIDRELLDTRDEPEQAAGTREPESLEMRSQWRGFMLYHWRCPSIVPPCAGLLRFERVSDRALVFDDKFRLLAIFSRNCNQCTVNVGPTRSISVLVENMGHVNFETGINGDRKGILGRVHLGREEAVNWFHIPLSLEQLFKTYYTNRTLSKQLPSVPTLFVGEFTVESAEDTFLRLEPTQWRKGVAFVNGVNIGRYWPAVGPQETLYVPAAFLRAGFGSGARNTLWLFELEPPPVDSAEALRSATFVDAHSIRPDASPEPPCRVLSTQPAA